MYRLLVQKGLCANCEPNCEGLGTRGVPWNSGIIPHSYTISAERDAGMLSSHTINKIKKNRSTIAPSCVWSHCIGTFKYVCIWYLFYFIILDEFMMYLHSNYILFLYYSRL